jgi:hypothetical protein
MEKSQRLLTKQFSISASESQNSFASVEAVSTDLQNMVSMIQNSSIPNNSGTKRNAIVPKKRSIGNISGGGTTQNGVTLTVSADNAGGSVSSTPLSLAAGAVDSLITATWTPAVSTPVNYALTYTFSQTQTDATPTDNVKTDAIKITNSVYSVDNGVAAGSISNLADQPNQPLKIGNVMEVMAADRLDSMLARNELAKQAPQLWPAAKK